MATDDERHPRLVVTEPAEQAGLVLSLSAAELVIGHSDTADLVLDDRYVSRRHALVTTDASGAVTILDLNSTGGTFVNDERLDRAAGAAARGHGPVRRPQARFEPAVSAPGVACGRRCRPSCWTSPRVLVPPPGEQAGRPEPPAAADTGASGGARGARRHVGAAIRSTRSPAPWPARRCPAWPA